MNTVFSELTVMPAYGKYRAVISWKAAPEVAGGDFTVLKSIDGVNEWLPIAAGNSIAQAVDENLLNQGKMIEQYYRVQVVKNGKTWVSDSVSTMGSIPRHLFGAARVLMQREYEVLRKFTALHVCTLRTNANACPLCVDADTEQAVGTSLCPVCWGTKFEGGYFPPVLSYGRFITTSPMVQLDSEEGTGTSDTSKSLVRMLAFPILRKDDMFVNKEADRRYLVEDVEYDMLAGKVPVIANVRSSLMVTTDVRYNFPL